MPKYTSPFISVKTKKDDISTSSNLSTDYLEQVLESLKGNKNQQSTKMTYYRIWKGFNKFILKLDRIPEKWEDRFTLYASFLVKHKNIKSSTIKTYCSAIKSVLTIDGYEWCDKAALLSTFVGNSKMHNDRVKTRLPIGEKILELSLFELERHFIDQVYLEILYKTMFSTSYYGLFRVGELTSGPHTLKVSDVHAALNKSCYLFVLHTSKTHGLGHNPQKITISRDDRSSKNQFCPVQLIEYYTRLRPKFLCNSEAFFVFRDRQPIQASQFRAVLRTMLMNLKLNANAYNTHSFRAGRATDLMKTGVPLESIKHKGRWRLNAIYDYLK